MSLRAAGSSSITMALNTWFIFHEFMNINSNLLSWLVREMNLILSREKEIKFVKNTLHAIAGYQVIRKCRTIVGYMHDQSFLICLYLQEDLSHLSRRLQPVFDGILYHRLKNEAGNKVMISLLFDADRIIKLVL